jgi:hypothetical protein
METIKNKKQTWIQTIIVFVETTTEYLETQFHNTFKSMDRFYALYFYNTFKTKSFNRWQRISKNIQNKINQKDVVHQYATKLYLNY